MPKVIIVSTGKSGTNVLFHALRASDKLSGLDRIEDKAIFNRGAHPLPDNYFCKCDTLYVSMLKMVKFMHYHPDVFILWPTRHPNDLILSKITTPFYSRHPENTPDDATMKGSTESIVDSHIKLKYLLDSKCRDRVVVTKFEDVLEDPVKELSRICERVKIPFDVKMVQYHDRFPDSVYRDKYDKKENIANKWVNYENMPYANWLVERGFSLEIIEGMFDSVSYITADWGYDV